MTDQIALLAAIRDNPAARTPRLMYADLLDEHGTCDRDRATAEFIRLALGPTGYTRQWPRAAYQWLLDVRPSASADGVLAGNYGRLVPSLCALDATDGQRAEIYKLYTPHIAHLLARDYAHAPPQPYRVGKLVELYLNLRPAHCTPIKWCALVRFHLTFDAGFLRKCDVAAGTVLTPAQLAAISAAVAADQPLCRAVGVFR